MSSDLSQDQQDKLDAAAFRRLLAHLQERTDVQNIDIMILADFCRNCLSNWYQEAAQSEGLTVTKDEARERVYGMAYDTWKDKHQSQASPEQMAAFKRRHQH